MAMPGAMIQASKSANAPAEQAAAMRICTTGARRIPLSKMVNMASCTRVNSTRRMEAEGSSAQVTLSAK